MRSISDLFSGIFARFTSEPRRPEESRVPYNPRTVAGVTITPDTAITISAYWAGIRYLSQTVAVLPWHVMRTTPAGGERASNSPIDWLLWQRASDEWSAFQFRETLTHWALRWGNGYAEIERDAYERPVALWPIHPERTEVCRATAAAEDAYGTAIPAGGLYYEVSNGTGSKTVLAPRNMFHIRGFGEGPVGVNVTTYAAQSLGWARAAQIFGAAYFGNGAVPSTIVRNKKPLSPAGLDRQRKEMRQLYGGPAKAHGTAHLDADAEIERIGLNAAETQLIEVHQHLIEEVCRWVGAPPHKVMHLLRAHYNNIEHQNIEVVVDAISPWAKRFEDEANHKLFGGVRWRGFYTKMNMNALLRGDMKARMEFYRGMVQVGAYSPNRILQLEDENTIGAEGDIHVMQEQMSTLRYIAEKEQKTATPESAPSPRQDQPDEGDAPAEDDAAADARSEFEAAMSERVDA